MPYRVSAVVALVVVGAGLGLLACGCGGSSGSGVAQVGSSTTTSQAGRSTPDSTGASTSGGATIAQALAYSRCMRSHGVPSFPDPDSSGRIPKPQVLQARQSDPTRFDAADRGCQHLLPSGGSGETPAALAQEWNEFRKLARCMRSNGLSNWPDPTSRSGSDRRPTFNLTAVGIDIHSPHVLVKVRHCAALSNLLPSAH